MERIHECNWYLFEPFLCLWIAMRTPRPTARALFTADQFLAHTFNMLGSRFWFFNNGYPANPFVSGNWSNSIPSIEKSWVRTKLLLYVWRNFVECTVCNRGLGHAGSVANWWRCRESNPGPTCEECVRTVMSGLNHSGHKNRTKNNQRGSALVQRTIVPGRTPPH